MDMQRSPVERLGWDRFHRNPVLAVSLMTQTVLLTMSHSSASISSLIVVGCAGVVLALINGYFQRRPPHDD